VVCCLTLTHLLDLHRPFAEFVRVLRPGGDVIISDAAGMAAGVRPPIVLAGPDGSPGYLPHHRRDGDYLKAALPLGLEVRRCEEPRRPEPYVDPDFHPSIETMLPDGPPNLWWLHHWVPRCHQRCLSGHSGRDCLAHSAEELIAKHALTVTAIGPKTVGRGSPDHYPIAGSGFREDSPV
jgi:hypothetical protein